MQAVVKGSLTAETAGGDESGSDSYTWNPNENHLITSTNVTFTYKYK